MRGKTVDRLRGEIARIEGLHRSRRKGKGRKPDPATLASFDPSVCAEAEVGRIAADFGLGKKLSPN